MKGTIRSHQDRENALKVIECWMRMVLATDGIERFDDLHIDKVDPGWKSRESWVDGSAKAIALAKELKSSIAPDKTLALMCGLIVGEGQLANPRSANELSEQIDWTPPSLYLFNPGSEPWMDSGRVAVSPVVETLAGCSRCFVMEFRAQQDQELRRTFVAVA